MKYIVIITDDSTQFGGEVNILCATRLEAIRKARSELKQARAIGIKCYAKVLPKRARPEKDFKYLGWMD